MDSHNRVTFFAETDARNKRTPFGIKYDDRSRHMYVIGKTGMGKSTLLENMAVQDIRNGEGIAFMDPHGKTADLLLEYVPEERIKDVIYFAPFDTDNPISFNIMEDVGPDKRHLVANGLMAAFKKIWVDAWSARMEYILNNTILALLEYPDATLLGVNRMLTDKAFRKKVVANISDTSVKAFWVDEYEKWDDRYAREAGAAIQNKVGQFVANPLVRNIIGQTKSSFDLRQIMDERKIVIVNLSKGQVGEANANLLGSMLITKMYLAAMSRADLSEDAREALPQFHLYVDEFQSFANESFADILSEARKYRLALTVAHQYIEQMSDEVRAAVFGNVGTMVSFRVGSYDAEVLEKEFAPMFTAEDMVNLGFAQIYLKLMIDGVSSQPFSATTLVPIPKPETSSKPSIIEHSRAHFAKSRNVVEKDIAEWYGTEDKNSGGGDRDKGRDNNRGGDDRNKKRKPDFRPREEKPAVSFEKKEQKEQKENPFQKIKEEFKERPPQQTKQQNEQKRQRPKKVQRDASPEKMSALRDTIAAAMGSGAQPDQKEKLAEEQAEKKPESVEKVENKKPGEVPEDVLKKILSSD